MSSGAGESSPGRLLLVASALASGYAFALLWLVLAVLAPAVVLGWTPTTVVSGSMQPAFDRGDVVLVQSSSSRSRVTPGRVIVFRDPSRPSRTITHRVVAVNEDGTYQTRGDANASADSTPLDPRHVIGTVHAIVPAVGLPVVWARDGELLVLSVWAAATLLVLVGLTTSPAAPRGPPLRLLSIPTPGAMTVLPRGRRGSNAWRPVTALVTAGAVVVTVSGGASAAFTWQTDSTSSLSAASHFAPAYQGLIGTSSCGSALSTITVPAAGVAAGSTVVVRLVQRETPAGTVSFTDSRGNTWTKDADAHVGKVRTVVASAYVATALVGGDTLTVTHPTGGKGTSAAAITLTGVAPTNRVDTAVTSGSASNNSAPSVTATTTTPNAILVSAVGSHNRTTSTEATGWTSAAWQAVTCSNDLSDSRGAVRTAKTTGSYTYALTLNNGVEWAAALVAYRLDERVAPTIPTLTGSIGDAEATLTWSEATDPWAPITYQLYRDGLLLYSGPNRSYIDLGLTNGVSYTYVVRATDGGGNQSASSNAVLLTPQSGASVRFVKDVGAASGCSTTATTVPVPAAGVAAGSTLLLRLVLRNPATGAVTASDGSNTYAVDADAAQTTLVRTVVLSAPVTTALAAGTSITVTHPSASAAVLDVVEFSGVLAASRVDVAAAAKGSSATAAVTATTTTRRVLLLGGLGTTGQRAQTTPTGWAALPTATRSCGTTIADSRAGWRTEREMSTFSYTAGFSGGNEDWAATLVAYRSVHDDTPPAVPVLTAVAGDARATLSWPAVTDPSAPVTYLVHRDGVLLTSTTSTSYEDLTAANGTAYRYTVRAKDAANNVSVTSNEVTVIPTPIRFVRTVSSAVCGIGSSTIVVPAGGIPAGRTLVVRVGIREGTPETGGVSATDSVGNTYTVDADAVRAGRVRTVLLSTAVRTALTGGQSITVTHPTGKGSAVSVDEVAGIATAGRVDATGIGSENNKLPTAAATATTALTLAYGAVTTRARSAHEPTPGWVRLPEVRTTCADLVDSNAGYLVKSTASQASYAPFLPGGDEWAAALVIYRAAVDVTPPPVPVLSGETGYEQATLSWTAVTDPSGPVSYDLYRDDTLAYSGAATTFTDTGLVNGELHDYVVRATDPFGNTSAASNTVRIAPTPIQYLGEVGRVTCGGAGSTVVIPSGGVAAGNTLLIRVVVREGSDTGLVSATDSAGNTYTRDADAVRPGRVRTVVLSAHVGTALTAGQTISVTHPDGKAEGVVVDAFSGIAATDRVDGAGTGSNNTSTPAASVTTQTDRVLLYGALGTRAVRSYGPASGYTPLTGIAQVGCGSSADLYGGYRTAALTGTFTYATTLTGGTDEWAAALVAYRSEIDVTPPPVPTLRGAPGNTAVTLTWGAVTDPTGPVTYQLFRGATKVYDGPALTFTDTGLENGRSYVYTVRSLDGLKNTSAASPALQLVPTPIAYVKALGAAGCGGTTNVLTVPAGGVAAGNRVVLRVVVREGSDTDTISAVDSAGNSYAVDAGALLSTKIRVAVLSAHVQTPLTAGQSITVTTSVGRAQIFGADEFTGIAPTSAVETFGAGSSTTQTPSAALTTATPSTLLYGALGTHVDRVTTLPAGWTPLTRYVTGLGCDRAADSSAAYGLVSTAASWTFDPTLSGGDEWAAVIVAYRPRTS